MDDRLLEKERSHMSKIIHIASKCLRASLMARNVSKLLSFLNIHYRRLFEDIFPFELDDE